MLENAKERELKERLESAGAGYWGGGLLALLDGAGMKAVEERGDDSFRVAVSQGFLEAPGSYAGIANSLYRAAAQLGYDTSFEVSAGSYDLYVLTPRS